MHGLPKDFDSTFFLGQTLELVCFSANQVYLHFSDNISVTIEGEFLYRKSLEQVLELSPKAVLRTELIGLLEHSIHNAFGEDNGTLTLIFENSHIVKCFDNSSYNK